MLNSKIPERNIIACILKKPQLIYEVDIKTKHFTDKEGKNHNRNLFKILNYIASKKDMTDSEFDVTTIISYTEGFSEVKKSFKKVFGKNENSNVKKEVTKYIDYLKKLRVDPENVDLFVEDLLKLNAGEEILRANKETNLLIKNNIGQMSLSKLLNISESSVLKISNKYASVEGKPEQIGEGMMDKYLNREVNEKGFSGYETPFKSLNEYTSGILRGGSTTIFNAPTGVGKSIILKNIVKHVGVDLNEPIYWGANEMTKDEQRDRILAEIAKVNPNVITNGLYNKKGNEDLKEDVIKAIKVLEDAPIFLDQIRGYTPEMLVRRARFFKKKHNIKGFVWDYVKRSSAYCDSEEQLRHWLGDVVGTLKEDIADPLDIFVVSATQSKTYQELYAAESQDIERHSTCFIPFKELSPEEKKKFNSIGDYAMVVKKNRYGAEHNFESGEFIPMYLNKKKLKFEEA